MLEAKLKALRIAANYMESCTRDPHCSFTLLIERRVALTLWYGRLGLRALDRIAAAQQPLRDAQVSLKSRDVDDQIAPLDLAAAAAMRRVRMAARDLAHQLGVWRRVGARGARIRPSRRRMAVSSRSIVAMRRAICQ